MIGQASEGAENVLPVRVKELNFAGATTSIKLDSNGLQLEALVLDPDGLAVGDSSFVTLPADRLLILKE